MSYARGLELPPLVGVAHGSREPRAAAVVAELLGLVRERAAGRGLAGLRVRAAFLGHAAPSVRAALDALPDGPAVVLPLLLTAAWHTRTDLPAALRAAVDARVGRGLDVAYGAPLGPHPLLIAALERRLAEAGVPVDDPAERAGTAVVLAAAGSADPDAVTAIGRLAGWWQSRGRWAAVVPGYASAAAPDPAAAVSGLLATGARRVVVASYLLAPGRFASQVREAALGAGAAAVSGALGATPELADVVLDRYQDALRQAGGPRAQAAVARAARIA